jgi:hypothetical protein
VDDKDLYKIKMKNMMGNIQEKKKKEKNISAIVKDDDNRS